MVLIIGLIIAFVMASSVIIDDYCHKEIRDNSPCP